MQNATVEAQAAITAAGTQLLPAVPSDGQLGPTTVTAARTGS